jgi:hypothetical protein
MQLRVVSGARVEPFEKSTSSHFGGELMRHFCTIVLFACLWSAFAIAQTTKDPSAVSVLTQVLNTAGGASAVRAVQDYTATGDITYYWAGEDVLGSATLRGKGVSAFRLDANLPSGTRSWCVLNGEGKLMEADGKITSIPVHNALRLGVLSFPLRRIAALVIDPSISIYDRGSVQMGARQFRQIRFEQPVPSAADPDGSVGRLGTFDVFIDPASNLIVGLHDQTHPTRSMNVDIPHALYFSDYRAVNGVLMPFLISEWMGGQRIWSVQLASMTFNTGLADSDFQF